MSKVYCENCKHHSNVFQRCNSNSIETDTWLRVEIIFSECCVKNKDNNCKEFEAQKEDVE